MQQTTSRQLEIWKLQCKHPLPSMLCLLLKLKKNTEEMKNNAFLYGLEGNKTAIEDINELMQKPSSKHIMTQNCH